MKRIVNRGFILCLAAGALAGSAARAEEAATPPSTIEERLSILERKYENDQAAAAAKAKDGATVTANAKDGFQIKSNDGDFSLRVTGYLQTDYRDFLKDRGAATIPDTFQIRRARSTVQGTVNRNVDFRITADFANGGGTTSGPTSTLLPDAYVEWKPRPWSKLRIGKFKSPISLEQLQTDTVTLFAERGLPTQLAPTRDTGVQLSGDILDGALTYQAAILNGVADAASGEADANDQKDYVGRLFARPFKTVNSDWINGLGLGIAGSIGDQFGSATTSGLTAGYRTNGIQTFYTYTSGTFANGQRKRISPQANWYVGSVGLQWEYAASSQELRRVSVSTRTATITNRAWQIAGSFVLTGERASYSGVKPRKAFDPKNRGWGAFEVAGRYQIFRAEDEAFENGGFFSSPTSSAKKARAWTAGLNWYANNNVRVTSDYDVTSFVGGAAGANRATERVVISRLQLVF